HAARWPSLPICPILTSRSFLDPTFHGTDRARLEERVEQQPREQLGKEVGRLRGHVLTAGGDVTDEPHRRGPHQEGGVVSPGANALHGLLGVARVEEAVEVGYVVIAQPERALQEQRL